MDGGWVQNVVAVITTISVTPHQHSTSPHTRAQTIIISSSPFYGWAEHLASLARITRCHPSPSASRAHTQHQQTPCHQHLVTGYNRDTSASASWCYIYLVLICHNCDDCRAVHHQFTLLYSFTTCENKIWMANIYHNIILLYKGLSKYYVSSYNKAGSVGILTNAYLREQEFIKKLMSYENPH